MDEEEKERLENIVNDLNRDVEMPPYDNDSQKGYSRDYKKYKEEEIRQEQDTRFEKFCKKSSSILNIKAGEYSRDKLGPPLRLLGWEVSPGMVISASILTGLGSFLAWGFFMILNMITASRVQVDGEFVTSYFIPMEMMVIFLSIPIAAAAYTYLKPVYDAQSKMIDSSGEMILSILYMVVYLRSSPNLEGAVRFAALNLEGPISDDLKQVLWDVEIGNYSTVTESLENYARVWKDYNEDYLQSLQLLKAAVNERDSEKRENLLQDAIDRILDGTQEKMKHYAQSLKTPVMILNAMGAMLPVLGMIMLPLISVFLGGAVSSLHLLLLFNFLLPGFLYWFMQRILNSRPPTVSSQPTSEEELPKRGLYYVESLDRSVPVWPFGLALFLVIAAYGIFGYISTIGVNGQLLVTYPTSVDFPVSEMPAIFRKGDELAPIPMLMRSLSITFGAGISLGLTKYLGSLKRKEAEEELRSIEEQFPTALFQLGNKISGGTPIELALEQAAESTSDLEISKLFQYSSRNVREMGMTFEDAVFDSKYGALRHFPSQMIHTVMKAILEASEKGTTMASMAMMTISRYLDNIHKTQEQLNDLMEETTTTIQMLAYLLAPVVSGVAVGMSQTIITAMFRLSSGFQQVQGDISANQAAGQTGQFSGILGNLNAAISPEILQFVVGIYLIQLLWILGTFFTKIRYGENKTYRNIFVGKVLISGMIFYTITLLTISLLFGGIVGDISAAA